MPWIPDDFGRPVLISPQLSQTYLDLIAGVSTGDVLVGEAEPSDAKAIEPPARRKDATFRYRGRGVAVLR